MAAFGILCGFKATNGIFFVAVAAAAAAATAGGDGDGAAAAATECHINSVPYLHMHTCTMHKL